jgi:hypothetical protein
MDQDAGGWKTLLTRANQLVRSATHPAAQLPVEGHLPGFDGQGQIRHHRFGEGDDEMSEMIIQQLLIEAGRGGADRS